MEEEETRETRAVRAALPLGWTQRAPLRTYRGIVFVDSVAWRWSMRRRARAREVMDEASCTSKLSASVSE